MSFNKFIQYLNEVNCSFQMLINFGYANNARFDFFTFTLNTNIEESINTTDTRPHFYFDCWNPLQKNFSSFEIDYLSRSSSSYTIRYKEMKYHYLPYQCLYRLLNLYKQKTTENALDLLVSNQYPHTLPICNEFIDVELVRTSQKSRSYNIDETNLNEILQWRLTKENERYPYSIELLTQTGESLGELPNDLSACLAPLLEQEKINISAKVKNIEKRCNRGSRARCSLMSITLCIEGLSKIPVETYFNIIPE